MRLYSVWLCLTCTFGLKYDLLKLYSLILWIFHNSLCLHILSKQNRYLLSGTVPVWPVQGPELGYLYQKSKHINEQTDKQNWTTFLFHLHACFHFHLFCLSVCLYFTWTLQACGKISFLLFFNFFIFLVYHPHKTHEMCNYLVWYKNSQIYMLFRLSISWTIEKSKLNHSRKLLIHTLALT